MKLERVKSLDEIDKKDLPANTSKIIFYLVCVGPRKKEKLVTFLPIGFLHPQLIKLAIAIHVETEISSDECWMKITFEGESNREDIIQIAKLIIPRLEDLRLNEEYWDSGNLGLMQIILIAQISDLLQNNNNQRVPDNNYA